MTRARLAAIALFLSTLLFVGVMVWGITTLGSRTEDNCQRIHQLVMTLDKILESGDAQTQRYVAEGTLTPEQGRRADVYREEQRHVLGGADCPPQ